MIHKNDPVAAADKPLPATDLPAVPVKLLKVMTSYYEGGTEGQVLKLSRKLDRARFALQFASLQNCGNLMEQYAALQVPMTEFRISNLYGLGTLSQQLRFAWFLHRQQIAIVHSYNFYSNVFGVPAAWLARVPVIFASIRDQGVYLTPAQKRVQKWVCRLADRILVNAESIRDWLLEQGYEADKIVVIRNGLDLALYQQDAATGTAALRRELGIPAEAPVVLMMSRLNPLKGVEDFIKAAALVRQQRPDAWFLLVGGKVLYAAGEFSHDQHYVEGLQQLVQAHGLQDRLLLTGHRSDTACVLAAAAVSVLPSYSEGLSNTLLESLAAGAPVVATRVGGNPELITDGVNGLLVEPGAPEQLAHAITRILADPELAQNFSAQGRRRVQQLYSLDTMADRTQALYDDALRAKP